MEYVEQRDGGYYLAGTRIGLDSVIHSFKEGAAPETILRSFPMAGSLEKIYGAITFYLANQELVEAYLRDQDRLDEEAGAKQTPLPNALAEKLARAKSESLTR